MTKNPLLTTLLIFQTLALLLYSYWAFSNEGLQLVQVLLANVRNMGWNGQFNLDFSCYLLLSGLWLMWRAKFKAKAVVPALLAMILGILFFAPYVLYLLQRSQGDVNKLLLGDRQK